MFISKVALLGLLTALCQGVPTSHVRHETRDVQQHEARWIKRGKAPADAKLPVRIAISQRNLEYGHDMLMDISDPSSPNFGKHMTSKEVADFFSPGQESIDAISEWLAGAGIDADRYNVSPGKHWIKFDSSVEELEGLIQTKYHTFTHKDTGAEHLACDEYHVPHTVHPHIDFITPTVGMTARLNSVTKRSTSRASLPPITLGPYNGTASKSFAAAADTCYEGITPACIRGTLCRFRKRLVLIVLKRHMEYPLLPLPHSPVINLVFLKRVSDLFLKREGQN